MTQADMTSDRETIGSALAGIPSGCSILTVAHEQDATGVLVSWVQQASFEPPAVSLCLKPDRPAAALVDAAGCFVLNIIGEDPGAMFKHFGKGFAPGEDAFAGLRVADSAYGPLLADCPAQLGCRVKARVDAGDHTLYVADVAAAIGLGHAKPYVHLRKSGLGY